MATALQSPEIAVDPIQSAKQAGLRYVADYMPGIAREVYEGSFIYRDVEGKIITDLEVLRRIDSLKIPPAWARVWICPNPRGHLQATGRDVRGRKQYIYHPQWREVRDETKFYRAVAFGQALPGIRKRVRRDLAKPGISREKVLATIVRLLEMTLIRVGNDEYAQQNDSYGLTTLRDGHVEVSGSCLRFKFKGKRGKFHDITTCDRQLARIVKRSQDLPGEVLFSYLDENGVPRSIESDDVNQYLREITGDEFTAKDFRTWAGTVLAAVALHEIGSSDTKTGAKRSVSKAIKRVAERLGNTPAICRKSYVHPAVLESYLDGTLAQTLVERVEEELESEPDGLQPDEAAVLQLLAHRLEAQSKLAA